MKAIINVRLGSTRLPGKVLMNICDKPALQHLIERVGKSKYIEDIIINTTTEEIDNKIVDFCKENHYLYNRGSEEDVTSRISSAINNYQIKNFVEIYGDCPLVDYRIIDSAIEYFNANDLDFYGNDLKTTFPPGFEVEVVINSFSNFRKIRHESWLPFVIDVKMPSVGNFLLQEEGSLWFSSYEEDLCVFEFSGSQEFFDLFKSFFGFFEIKYMDSIGFSEEERTHFWIPAAGTVSNMKLVGKEVFYSHNVENVR